MGQPQPSTGPHPQDEAAITLLGTLLRFERFTFTASITPRQIPQKSSKVTSSAIQEICTQRKKA